MARVALEGRSFNDFYWKAQMQVSGTTKDDNTAIRLIDLFVECDKWRLKARYDVYREEKKWSTSKTFYEIGADYHFTKKLRMNLEYARVNDRSISSGVSQHNYNLVDAQLDILF